VPERPHFPDHSLAARCQSVAKTTVVWLVKSNLALFLLPLTPVYPPTVFDPSKTGTSNTPRNTQHTTAGRISQPLLKETRSWAHQSFPFNTYPAFSSRVPRRGGGV